MAMDLEKFKTELVHASGVVSLYRDDVLELIDRAQRYETALRKIDRGARILPYNEDSQPFAVKVARKALEETKP